MSIWTINREQLNKEEEFLNPEGSPTFGFIRGGTGLPFYLNQLSQSRYNFANTRNHFGGWKVPSNKLPTWQVVGEVQVYQVSLIEASNDNDTPDGPPNIIPEANNFYRKCYDNENGSFQTIICDDRDRDFLLDCNKSYYFQLGLEDYPDLFSELFTVYDYNLVNFKLTKFVLQITPANADVEFTLTIEVSSTVGGSGGNINGTPLSGLSTTIQLNLLDLVPQTITTELNTTNAGTFKQDYSVEYSSFTQEVTITKIYQ